MSLKRLRLTLTALQRISGVTLRLCDLQMKTLFSVGDEAPVPKFKNRPERETICYQARAKNGDYLLVGFFQNEACVNYIIAGPCQINADDFATILVHSVNNCNQSVVLKTSPVTPLKHISARTDLKPEIIDTDATIIRHYDVQNRIMAAITHGNHEQVDTILTTSITGFHSFFSRIPNRRLRSAKNILYVFNTLCRMAAARGGIGPVVLDRLSGHYAVIIEQLSDVGSSDKLTTTMALHYCDLVQSHRQAHYSTKISQTVQWLSLHYQERLTLAQIAAVSHSAPTYLSQSFKEETGETVFGFINHYRIQSAKRLLRQPHTSVTEIAFQVGFNSVPYFNRMFKRYTGVAPLDYSKINEPDTTNESTFGLPPV